MLSTNTGTALLNKILIQRLIGLWGDGFRFFDLKSQGLLLDRTGENATIALSGVLTAPASGPEYGNRLFHK